MPGARYLRDLLFRFDGRLDPRWLPTTLAKAPLSHF
jgi:hypothetical protein